MNMQVWNLNGEGIEITDELIKRVLPGRTVLNIASELETDPTLRQSDGRPLGGIGWFAHKMAIELMLDPETIKIGDQLNLILALSEMDPPLSGWDKQTQRGYVIHPDKNEHFPDRKLLQEA